MLPDSNEDGYFPLFLEGHHQSGQFQEPIQHPSPGNLEVRQAECVQGQELSPKLQISGKLSNQALKENRLFAEQHEM